MSYTATVITASLLLAFTGFFYGTRLLQLKNPLLGYEWYILAFSASNTALYFYSNNENFMSISMFCDAFSRTVGIPVIGTLGVMQLTHGLKLSTPFKIALFMAGGVLAVMLRSSNALNALLPIGGFVLGLVFLWILVRLATQLFSLGRKFQSWLTMMSAGALLLVSLSDGIIVLPNPNHVIWLDFWFYALVVWAIAFAQIFYAYRALEHAIAKPA